jgi:glycosyltransferase involved in cell wall biosynthesis
MKRILLEASIFSKQTASGISKYLSQLLQHFPAGNTQYSHQTMVLKDFRKNLFVGKSGLSNTDFVPVTRSQFFLSMTGGMLPAHADLFHSPYMFLPPKSRKRKNVLTVHDVINLEKKTGARNQLRAKLLAIALNRADHFICISSTTREKLFQLLPDLKEHQIHTIYQGVDDIFFEQTDGEEASISINMPYLLYVGQRDGYKNFLSLVRYFAKSSWRSKMEVICVGGGLFNKEEQNMLREQGLTNSVRHAGYVSNRELKYLYQNAFALAYTSLAEGFGLPIVEAMACGCPVICGNFSSMREVSAGHNIPMNDFLPRSFDAAFGVAAEFGADQKAAARTHALRFTWEQTAHNTFELYKQLLS